jgi:D-inositol-3-phosphate glycosyltransferase
MLSVHSCPVGRLGAKDTGGMSVYVLELAREIGKRGHKVDIFTRAHDSEHAPVIEVGENVRLIHLPAGADEHIHKLAVYLYLPDFACQMENFRKRNNLKYNLLFSHYWLSAWVGKILQGWWNVPHMTMFHTIGAVKNSVGIGEDEPELRVETERYLVRNCDHVIATTEREKEDIISHYGASPERIGVIPCGVNLDLFRPMDRKTAKQQLGVSEGKTILFVGRLEPLKGIDKLLMAMKHIAGEPGLRLMVIGGDGNSHYDTELQRLSGELGIQHAVTFEGLVKHEDLPQFYNAADVCVIPSYYESFGLVTLESLACGAPVVSTRAGGAESVIQHGVTGYLVEDNSPHQLAKGIKQLLSRPEVDAEFTASVRASVAGFSWPDIAGKVVKEGEALIAHYHEREH